MATQNLGEAAQAGLAGIDEGAQETFEGMDYTKVKFNGVQHDTIESNLKIGDEVTCTVRGRVVGTGDKQMNDGHIRHEVVVKVSSVVMQD